MSFFTTETRELRRRLLSNESTLRRAVLCLSNRCRRAILVLNGGHLGAWLEPGLGMLYNVGKTSRKSLENQTRRI
jgi:hypothetical protein